MDRDCCLTRRTLAKALTPLLHARPSPPRLLLIWPRTTLAISGCLEAPVILACLPRRELLKPRYRMQTEAVLWRNSIPTKRPRHPLCTPPTSAPGPQTPLALTARPMRTLPDLQQPVFPMALPLGRAQELCLLPNLMR